MLFHIMSVALSPLIKNTLFGLLKKELLGDNSMLFIIVMSCPLATFYTFIHAGYRFPAKGKTASDFSEIIG